MARSLTKALQDRSSLIEPDPSSQLRRLSKLVCGLSAGLDAIESAACPGGPSAIDSIAAVHPDSCSSLHPFYHLPQVALPVSTYPSFRKNPAVLGNQLFLLAGMAKSPEEKLVSFRQRLAAFGQTYGTGGREVVKALELEPFQEWIPRVIDAVRKWLKQMIEQHNRRPFICIGHSFKYLVSAVLICRLLITPLICGLSL